MLTRPPLPASTSKGNNFFFLQARGKLKVKKTKSRRSKRRKKAITGVMSGKVINAVNGKGVRGAKITVLRRGVVAKTVRTTSRGMYYIRLVYAASPRRFWPIAAPTRCSD